MIRSVAAFSLAMICMTSFSSPAHAEDDEIVRLPGSGEVKSDSARRKLKADKLKPGGGLLASFDTDDNGRVSQEELRAGIEGAFLAADENGDGELTAIEQQKWAENLPTRDDSLGNPVRFDPNLDRRVSYSEFSAVISDLWADYRKDGQEVLRIADLKAPDREPNRRRDRIDEMLNDENPPIERTSGSRF